MDRAVMQALFMVQEKIEELKSSGRTQTESILNDLSAQCREIMKEDRETLEEMFDNTAEILFAYGVKNIDRVKLLDKRGEL